MRFGNVRNARGPLP